MAEKRLTMGSLFDGSGAFPLASMMSGIEPVWASEICPYPIRVTTKRLPFMKHYGDVSNMDGGKVEPVDIITFGSPCQDMSIAGKREGLDGARSGLFHQAVRIMKEMKEATDGEYPRYAVWENVCGALSSNDGEDFRCVLESLSQVAEKEVSIPRPEKGKWENAGEVVGEDFSIAWRVLSAEYFGVPQRRKRIYLVADFRGGRAGKILFEREGMPWHTPEGFRKGEGAAEDFRGCLEDAGRYCLNDQGGDRMDVLDGVAPTLRAQSHQHEPLVLGAKGFQPWAGKGIQYREEMAPTLVARQEAGVLHAAGFRSHVSKFSDAYKEEESPTIMVGQLPAVVHSAGFKPGQGKAAHGLGYEEEKSPTLLAGQEAGALVGTVPYTLKIRSGKEGGGKGPLVQEDKSATLATHQDQTLFQPTGMMFENHAQDARFKGPLDSSPTVTARYGTGGNNTPLVAEPDYVAFAQNQRDEVRDLGEKSGAVTAQPGMKQQTFVAEKASPVAFGVCGKTSQGYLSDNPKVGFYEAETARTLDNKELSNTLMARDYKDPQIVNVKAEGAMTRYIVRRLTPTECARLQGMPDWWCDGLEMRDPSEKEMEFWRDVFETWRLATSPNSKPKADSQIRKWLAGPFADSEQYKMWGNGIALPCGFFVLSGIAAAETGI